MHSKLRLKKIQIVFLYSCRLTPPASVVVEHATPPSKACAAKTDTIDSISCMALHCQWLAPRALARWPGATKGLRSRWWKFLPAFPCIPTLGPAGRGVLTVGRRAPPPNTPLPLHTSSCVFDSTGLTKMCLASYSLNRCQSRA